jgi:hypothetical protein
MINNFMPRRPVMNDEQLEEWFFQQKTIRDNGCWEWNGVINSGYGQLNVNGKRILAHRYSLQLTLKREIPRGIEVRHICNNPICINPEHLQEGTHIDNMKDMVNSNRQAKGDVLSVRLKGIPHIRARGEGNGRAKLTQAQVNEIRESNKSVTELANEFKVTKTHIRRLKTDNTIWNYEG